VSLLHWSKKFSTGSRSGHCVDGESIKNERIGAQADSPRRADKWCWCIERRMRTTSSLDDWTIRPLMFAAHDAPQCAAQ
jgi:hypothetical protein